MRLPSLPSLIDSYHLSTVITVVVCSLATFFASSSGNIIDLHTVSSQKIVLVIPTTLECVTDTSNRCMDEEGTPPLTLNTVAAADRERYVLRRRVLLVA